jgi:RNA polymerase sigma factor (sigma-70 family)
VRAMKAGAVDFLTKPVKREALLNAVQSALARDAEFRSAREKRGSLHSQFVSLTPREREVFTLVVAGKLNKQIANQLATSERTVKAHRAKVMEKMQVKSLAELVHVSERLVPNNS